MRIAYVCADRGVPVFGRKGCSVHVQEILRALLRRGAAIDLFAPRLGGACPADLTGVSVREVSGFRHPAAANDVEPLHDANARLRRELERGGPYDLVYERYSLWCCAGMEFARSAGVPGVLEVNAPLIEEQARYRQLNAPEFAQCTAERVFAAASIISAVSSQVAEYVRRIPSTDACIHVIHNGVDPIRFQRAEVAPAGHECGEKDCLPEFAETGSRRLTIGFVGSLKPWHGLATLVKAFAKLHRSDPDTRLLIVGDGPERENILAQLGGEGESTLLASCLAGAVPPEDVPTYLSRMDVAVAPYPALPGFYFSPLKIFEYMAAGLPVVASRIGDLPCIIRHGINGLLCAPDNAAELTTVLERLRTDYRLRRRLGEAARATVLARHTWDGVVQQVLSLAGLSAAGTGSEIERPHRPCVSGAPATVSTYRSFTDPD